MAKLCSDRKFFAMTPDSPTLPRHEKCYVATQELLACPSPVTTEFLSRVSEPVARTPRELSPLALLCMARFSIATRCNQLCCDTSRPTLSRHKGPCHDMEPKISVTTKTRKWAVGHSSPFSALPKFFPMFFIHYYCLYKIYTGGKRSGKCYYCTGTIQKLSFDYKTSYLHNHN